MRLKIAFAGFRHGHIMGLYALAAKTEGIEVVAACEEHAATREELRAAGTVDVTHDSFDSMLSDVACDAVAVGDVYAKRGSLLIRALEAGKHVIGDKPLCTDLDELGRIEELSGAHGLRVGCMLDLRDSPKFVTVREFLRNGTIGEVHAIAFGGQHPLMLGTRPSWYFEPGSHGGTINDIAIHAVDYIPWATGLDFATVNAARSWNAFVPEFPHFHDGGQMMLTMTNGCGVLGDVSYFMPNSSGYSLPFYWRMTFFGRSGILETSSSASSVLLARDGDKGTREEPLSPGSPGGYFRSYLADIAGRPEAHGLTTESVLRATRAALTIQQAADTNARDVPLA